MNMNNDNQNNRFDFVFSYWIFVWFVLYWFKWIDFSPKLALCLGLFENLVLFLFIILRKSWIFTFSFVVINLFIKIIPLYLLKNDKIYILRDLLNLVFVFLIYISWIFINGKLFVFQKIYEYTPGTNIISNFIEKYFSV